MLFISLTPVIQPKFDFKIPKPTHSISVWIRKSNDTKTFSVASTIDTKTLRLEIYKLIKKLKEQGTLQSPINDNHTPPRNSHNKEPTTHTILIKPKNTSESSISFTINIPHYTAEEVAEHITKYLCGGKCYWKEEEE